MAFNTAIDSLPIDIDDHDIRIDKLFTSLHIAISIHTDTGVFTQTVRHMRARIMYEAIHNIGI